MLAQAYRSKHELEAMTGQSAQALLVFSRAYLLGGVPAQRRGVTVLPARMLRGYLARRPLLLDRDAVRDLHARLLTGAP
jgi:hypothetical protein